MIAEPNSFRRAVLNMKLCHALAAVCCVVNVLMPYTTSAGEMEAMRDCADCPEMVALPGGEFEMGANQRELDWVKRNGLGPSGEQSEAPIHRVTVSRFWLSKTEVTRLQFQAFADATGRVPSGKCDWKSPSFIQTPDDPVVCTNWYDAMEFTRWLSRKTGRSYRLPTEVEWEYAARAGSTDANPWRYDDKNACRYANVFDQTAIGDYNPPDSSEFPCSDGFEFTAPVGSFAANGFGLHDMLGNVIEWTGSCSTINSSGPGYSHDIQHRCDLRIARGGSWFSGRQFQRVSYRHKVRPSFSNSEFGFRVVREF